MTWHRYSCGWLVVGCAAVCAAQTMPRHGMLTATKVTLRRMVSVVYGLTEPRAIGPEWPDKVHVDIEGRSPMLQALLKERHFRSRPESARRNPG